jgi:6-phosphogluconate dehydrogenase (decarboxylating)
MKVGFIGLGNVGSKLSGSLLRNNVDLYVHDLNDELLSKFKTLGAKVANNSSLRSCTYKSTLFRNKLPLNLLPTLPSPINPTFILISN